MSNNCNLNYIPSHLHWDDKPIIPNFFPNEKVFRRVSLADNSSFSSISLVDVSVNRSGQNDSISKSDDVLWDTTGKIEKHTNCQIETLAIEKQNFHVECKKIFYDDVDKSNFVIVRLLHKPQCCNYAHCAFEFEYQGQVCTFENYTQLLGNKKDKIAKRLRKLCRDELDIMVFDKKIVFP